MATLTLYNCNMSFNFKLVISKDGLCVIAHKKNIWYFKQVINIF